MMKGMGKDWLGTEQGKPLNYHDSILSYVNKRTGNVDR